MNSIEKYISGILRPFPRIRFLVKRFYQVGAYTFSKIKSLFNIPEPDIVQAEPVGNREELCFFGYFDKCPWDSSGNYLLCLKVPFDNRMPKPGEAAEICFFNSTDKTKLKTIA